MAGVRRDGATLGLSGCDGSDLQRFLVELKDDDRNGKSYELRSIGEADDVRFDPLCLVVGGTTRQANRYVARDLYLESCEVTPDERKL